MNNERSHWKENIVWESPWGVMGYILFELQSRYYVHFQTNTLWKGMNRFISLAMG